MHGGLRSNGIGDSPEAKPDHAPSGLASLKQTGGSRSTNGQHFGGAEAPRGADKVDARNVG
jgi:hypothetical protein